jgi:hypothetical protein
VKSVSEEHVASMKLATSRTLLDADFSLGLLFDLKMEAPKCYCTFIGLYGIIFQKVGLLHFASV